MQPVNRITLASSSLVLLSLALMALCQTSGQTVIQRPVVQTVNLHTTVSGPASTVAPPMPSEQATRAFIIAKRAFEKDIRRIRGKYLGAKQFPATRQRGLEELEQFTDPAAVEPLIEIARKDHEDVREWLFDHFAERLDPEVGQATLAWLAINDEEAEMRAGALKHLKGPAGRTTDLVVERALESPNMQIVSAGAGAAGALHLVQAIPHLIVAQQPALTMQGQGDMAYILVGTQRYLVTDLQPVVGDNSVGFDPTLSAVTEGTVVRIQDAIVEFYNLDAHNALVNIVKDDFGQPVDFGFNVPRWQQWYNEEYMPFARARDAKLATPAPAAPSK